MQSRASYGLLEDLVGSRPLLRREFDNNYRDVEYPPNIIVIRNVASTAMVIMTNKVRTSLKEIKSFSPMRALTIITARGGFATRV